MPAIDDTDLFRPLAEWTPIISDHQQNVVRGAAEFLTAGQMETFQRRVALDLAHRQEQRAQRCKTLGIKTSARD